MRARDARVQHGEERVVVPVEAEREQVEPKVRLLEHGGAGAGSRHSVYRIRRCLPVFIEPEVCT